MASLDGRDVRLGDARPSGKIDLPPAPSTAKGTQRATEDDVVHGKNVIVTSGASSPIILPMDHADHVALIRAGVEGAGTSWLELGSGEGAFTLALADVLGPGGEIEAVDRDGWALRTAVCGSRTQVSRASRSYRGRG